MSETATEYPKLPRNTINRYGKPRGRYDYETVHTVVNTAPVLHVSFNTPDPEDPFPAILPMLGFMGLFSKPAASLNESLDLYIHGYISSRLMKLGSSSEEEGFPLTISATHLDGLILALTPNHHSYNYRSAILHGYALPIEDPSEKEWAMHQITNNVVSSRWENSRIPPSNAEMTSTQILKVKIIDASAKIRSGGPSEDRADLKDEELRSRVWTGIIPTWTAYGEPIAAEGKMENKCSAVPGYVKEYIKEQNEIGEKNAASAAKGAALGTK